MIRDQTKDGVWFLTAIEFLTMSQSSSKVKRKLNFKITQELPLNNFIFANYSTKNDLASVELIKINQY